MNLELDFNFLVFLAQVSQNSQISKVCEDIFSINISKGNFQLTRLVI